MYLVVRCHFGRRGGGFIMAVKPIPDGYHTITPYLIVKGAANAIDFYKKAFGATELFRMPGPEGRVMHAEIKIGDTILMVNDAMGGGKTPKALGGSPASLWVYVADGDALFGRATGAGAQVVMPMMDQFWGDRTGTLADPSGYQWTIATRKEDLTPAELNHRAEEFFKQMTQPT
jgi:PhnB protein